jgi:hypothetical protein
MFGFCSSTSLKVAMKPSFFGVAGSLAACVPAPGPPPGASVRYAAPVCNAADEKGVPMADIARYVDKQYEGMDFAQIADQPISALQGVSPGDAELLQKAFNVKTIRQLAELKFVKAAQAITLLAGAG